MLLFLVGLICVFDFYFTIAFVYFIFITVLASSQRLRYALPAPTGGCASKYLPVFIAAYVYFADFIMYLHSFILCFIVYLHILKKMICFPSRCRNNNAQQCFFFMSEKKQTNKNKLVCVL